MYRWTEARDGESEGRSLRAAAWVASHDVMTDDVSLRGFSHVIAGDITGVSCMNHTVLDLACLLQ